ncbi:MAG: restriction endonuclease subunit S [Roseivirga sp.]
MQTNNIPTLRFPGFEGEWESLKLKDISLFKSGGTPSKENPDFWDGEIPWISAASMTDKYLSKSVRRVTELGLKKGSKEAVKGSLLLLVRGSMLFKKIPVGIVDKNLAFNQDVKALEINNKSSSEFIYYWLTSSESKLLNLVLGTGIGAGKLDTDDLKNLRLNIPSLPEQQKIATFLTATDKRITQLSEKQALLEQYKKGMMQQLFSQTLRFKQADGTDYPDWEEKGFSEVYSFLTTNSLSREKLNYENGKVFNIHYGDIHTKFSTLFEINKENIPLINPDVDISKIKEENYCKEGDLVIADVSEDYNDIGKAIEIISLEETNVVAGLHTFLARPDKSKIVIGYAGHMMKCRAVRKQIMKIAQGTKVLGIATSRLGNIELGIPSLEEQTRIASFLSAIDQKITEVAQQLEQTQSFKKGLIQQMFV